MSLEPRLASYDDAIEELDKLKWQFRELQTKGNILKLVGQGEAALNDPALKELFESCIANLKYEGPGTGGATLSR